MNNKNTKKESRNHSKCVCMYKEIVVCLLKFLEFQHPIKNFQMEFQSCCPRQEEQKIHNFFPVFFPQALGLKSTCLQLRHNFDFVFPQSLVYSNFTVTSLQTVECVGDLGFVLI